MQTLSALLQYFAELLFLYLHCHYEVLPICNQLEKVSCKLSEPELEVTRVCFLRFCF